MSGIFRINIDTSRLQRVLVAFEAQSRKGGLPILLDTSKGFIRRAIALTPPAHGKADARAKQVGEAAVHDDLMRIFDPMDSAQWKGFFNDEGNLQIVPTHRPNRRGAEVTDLTFFLKRNEMESFHDRLRSKSTGRVRRVNRENLIGRKKSDISEIAFVTKQDFAWFERQTKNKVGVLASGWNAAAQKLGYNPPAWIRRHGTSRGQIQMALGTGRMQITMVNEVKFALEVKDLERRIQTALDQQAAAMEKRVAFYQEKLAARATAGLR